MSPTSIQSSSFISFASRWSPETMGLGSFTLLKKRVRLAARAIEQEVRQHRGYLLYRRSSKNLAQWRDLDRPLTGYDGTVLLDIARPEFDGEEGRRIHALIHVLTSAGNRVWLTPRLSYFDNAHKKYKWSALRHVFPLGQGDSPEDFDLCLTDRRTPRVKAKRTLQLVGQTETRLVPGTFALPYAMHPDHLDAGEGQQLSIYRNQPRKWRLFFGGNRDPNGYHPSELYTQFTTTPRPQVIRLAEQFFAGSVAYPKSESMLDQLMSHRHEGMVVLDAANYRVAPSRWLNVLSSSDFFLAAPGMTYPISHNCIESLAVGTIPILEYHDTLHPALEHGVNSLVFDGPRGFCDLLDEIQKMPRQRIETLRHGAANYFDEHLAASTIAQKLATGSFARLHMFAHLAKCSEGA